MSKSRLEAFSDGVLAILITIMVLELKVPHGTDLGSLRPLIPVFLSYVLSFLHLAIYWNNHHHLLQAVQRVNGRVLWANLHLLFWLSLVPFVTGWMGENNFAPWPVLSYGLVLFFAGLAYYFLESMLVLAHGQGSTLVRALGRDFKTKASVALYIVAIGLALWRPWLSCFIYAGIAFLWIIPDRRIERELATSMAVLLLLATSSAYAQPGPAVRLGSISGSLSYPSDEIPPLEIYAFVRGNPTQYRKLLTKKGQSTFLFTSVIPGEYFIVAYPQGEENLQGGYTQAVPCGLTVACRDHSLIPVQVKSGAAAGGVVVKDWYAPEGTFPTKPKEK